MPNKTIPLTDVAIRNAKAAEEANIVEAVARDWHANQVRVWSKNVLTALGGCVK